MTLQLTIDCNKESLLQPTLLNMYKTWINMHVDRKQEELSSTGHQVCFLKSVRVSRLRRPADRKAKKAKKTIGKIL